MWTEEYQGSTTPRNKTINTKYQHNTRENTHDRQHPTKHTKGLSDTKSVEALCCVLRLYVFLRSCVEARCVSVAEYATLIPTLSPTPHLHFRLNRWQPSPCLCWWQPCPCPCQWQPSPFPWNPPLR